MAREWRERKNVRWPVSRVLYPCGRWPFIWDARCRTPRATNPGGDPETDLPANRLCRPYLVLLPVGFAVPLPLPVARCALTAPFHPYPEGRSLGRAVCSLWHFPWGRPRRPLAGTVIPWSPDFPLPRRTAAIRPSDPLQIGGFHTDSKPGPTLQSAHRATTLP